MTNFYLSLWIANFGVVPLFSLAFFLFLPLAFSLFFLILFVFNVLEPIFKTFVKLFNLKQYFLTFLICIVKVFFITKLQTIDIAAASTASKRDIFIARGEQFELNINDLKSYSIGNKAVVSSKYYKTQNKLLIKGKSIGFSDIVIWRAKQKSTYNIYVISKKEQLNKYQAINGFKEIKLKATPINDNFYIEGKIDKLKDYIIFKSLMKDSKAISAVTISNQLKRSLIEQIYLELDHEVHFLSCTFKYADLICVISFEDLNNLKVQSLSKKYFIKMQPNNEIKTNENYKVTLNLLKIERNKQESLSLGSYKVEGELQDLLRDQSQLYESNSVLIKNDHLFAKSIASPSLIVSLDQENTIELGAESPFTVSNQFGQNTQWKFSGLRMQIKLFEDKGRMGINLTNELTSPREENISGNKIKSTFFIDLERKINIFRIKINQKNKIQESIPVLENIPILKDLFSHEVFETGDIEIRGYLTVEKENAI
jgi:hypothetical protein